MKSLVINISDRVFLSKGGIFETSGKGDLPSSWFLLTITFFVRSLLWHILFHWQFFTEVLTVWLTDARRKDM